MNCQAFEQQLAEVLGNEASEDIRMAFESHLAACESCRREYESLQEAQVSLGRLASPQEVHIERIDNRLIIQAADSTPIPFPSGEMESTVSPSKRHFATVFSRYAAVIMLAFASGYWLARDDDRNLRDLVDSPPRLVSNHSSGTTRSLQGALISAHLQKPTRSGLAKCLVALAN